tara:strand:+ start:1205 stop:1432 length:228 start_codon:yes stop_codon:yes gene_type:complete
LPTDIIPLSFVNLVMNPLKKSLIGSVLLLTSFIKYYREPEIFSSATIFLILGSLAVYFEYGSDNFKSKEVYDEEE